MQDTEASRRTPQQPQARLPEAYRDWFTAPGDVDDFIFYDQPGDTVSGR